MPTRVAVGSVVCAIVASAALNVWRQRSLASPDDVAAAAAHARALLRPSDLVVVEPEFLSSPQELLGDLPLLQTRHLHPFDLAGFTRVHLLEIDAVRSATHHANELTRVGDVSAAKTWPTARLTTYTLRNTQRIAFDLREELSRVQVTAHYADGVAAPCDERRGERWLCPRDRDWNYVGPTTRHIGEAMRRCVWAHPVEAGGRLILETPELALASGAKIIGGFGFTLHASAAAAAPVRVRITTEETTLLDAQRDVDQSWEQFEAPAPSGALRLEVSTTNNGAAHFCIALRVVEPSP